MVLLTFDVLRPFTKPYVFEEVWDAGGEALRLQQLRELSARRRAALEASASNRTPDERLDSLVSYLELLGRSEGVVR